MMKQVRVKELLTRLGERLGEKRLHKLQSILNYMRLGAWYPAHGFVVRARVSTREQLFDLIAAEVGDRQALYLEFGVWKGDATRYWSKILKNPRSILHGFDSFEGLPEDYDWRMDMSRGKFDVGGQIPHLDDPRVRFFPGWFDRVLPHYEVPEHDALILNMDADLYSSTIYVLNQLKEHLKPGTFLYFDDMSTLDHEPRAIAEFLRESGIRFELMAADVTLRCCVFRSLGGEKAEEPLSETAKAASR